METQEVSKSARSLLDLAKDIVRLEAQLEALREKFMAGVANGGQADTYEWNNAARALSGATLHVAPPQEMIPSSVANRVRTYFKDRPGQEIELSAIYSAMPHIVPRLIRATAARLAKDEVLKNTGRGTYKLIQK